ncbi:hypothetical protein DPM19_17520 [Actinomadura craniellae]|uniref:CU044_5270 family protein n=1 Tax=Actinomadura craniellae TaxID=2231787 RepID=A0A365H4P3_9ACTN|nr:hypothetical protein DPM19_17520 [Actinomadura craniellae]
MRMVRGHYPEPAPPTAQEIARAKALLKEPQRRSLPRLRWGLGGMVAVGVAAAVAITLAGGNPPAPPGPVHLDDRGMFLAAAEKAERQPTGNYWYVSQIGGHSYIMRARTGTYAVTGAHTESFSWWGAKPGMGEAFHSRVIPARPPTERDMALWRRAGSPSSFRVWSADSYSTYTTRAEKWRVDTRSGGGEFPGGLSSGDLRSLPTAPAELAERFLSRTAMRAAGALRPSAGREAELAGTKFMRVASLLAAPVPPKTRAGLMRALTTQPGVHAVGRATDPLGRRGIALASDGRATTVTGEFGAPKAEQGTYHSRAVIIFDERTGALLSQQEELTRPGGPYAEMKPGFVINYWTIRSAGWADARPTLPTGLPFG